MKFKNILYKCIIIVMALIIEIGIFNQHIIENIFNKYNTKIITLNEIQTSNWIINKEMNSMVSANNDPIIILSDINTYINNIEISVNTNENDLGIQFFYNDKDAEFKEENSIKLIKNSNKINLISINKYTQDLRIDIGDKSNIVINDLEIIINPNHIKISIIRLIVLIVLLYVIIKKSIKYLFIISKNYKNNKSIFIVMIFILFIRILFYSSLTSYFLTPDSYDYININSLEFFRLNLHEIRVPLYPLLIDIIQVIFGDIYYLNILVLGQIVISFISLILLYKILKLVINSNISIYIILILYGCSSSIMGWDKTILTESLALSGTVIYMYLLINYLYKPKNLYAIFSGVLPLILTMFRPTFLILIPITLGFWILRWINKKEERHYINKALVSLLISFIGVLGYGILFYNQYGNISLSNTLMRQELVLTIEEGYYKNFIDKELVEKIDLSIDNSGGNYLEGVNVVYNEYNKKEIRRFIKESKRNNKSKYLEDKILILSELSKVNFITNSWHGFNKNEAEFNQEYLGNTYYQVKGNRHKIVAETIKNFFFSLTFGHVYIIIILELIIIVISWRKNKEIEWISMGVFSITTATILGSVIGTYAEWGRTAICVLPYSYLALSRYLNYFFKKDNYIINNE
ncbi:MAG: glycosyltransferase family 39 protein [Clostridiales bacterium]|nr:glycosyltransferase family 39 protein [Clostridiales bacterium]